MPLEKPQKRTIISISDAEIMLLLWKHFHKFHFLTRLNQTLDCCKTDKHTKTDKQAKTQHCVHYVLYRFKQGLVEILQFSWIQCYFISFGYKTSIISSILILILIHL